MSEEPHFDNWQDAWEWHAGQTHQALQAQPLETLLEWVQSGRYDLYYTIWDAVKSKGDLRLSAPVLIQVLRREVGEEMNLVRYHCAGALFHLLGYPDDPLPELRRRVQWAHQGEPARQQALDELEALVKERLTTA